MTNTLTTLSGPARRPGESGYEAELSGFQTAVQRNPAAVVGAGNTADVVAAMTWARERGMPVIAQGTGHAPEPADDAMVITTRRMDHVTVDAERGTATFGAGASWNRILEHTAPYGLAPISGSAAAINATSYLLGGGLGLLSREYGYASDRLRSAELVDWSGVVRDVRAETEPELLWAVRGGRGISGIVSSAAR